ncbi:bifunctional 4-hydroxy-2-oxoglutarate aldolase/2-dehydro-3-deoxy-phosphogluconate aldolase [Hymenobacter sp. ASUV-10]|uniref:Bifunctional 4-hydroxy-2-oxoglutarate aldolase/2-dehydro-3-deoxy-phosphogluconate aldolase n=1 Tax=Hymenobacter aranciens TaxID=3063996 RepID=A0ABT9B9A2_9BACT|nr:bifunctional 4-hydroxy-2-oxoglutarate aldolase/2-dehydro-3-deoxy-phosphogluconate aldolase [Hymenobacter sp. ASUV-10]MDO7874844.1 bifunctional 4-hydroxy-2-oxoglutarate aldolase/2-dehydro-3-deoxy-phosphogluconate aldolase [Hymenobacter sp. ASUV-10]
MASFPRAAMLAQALRTPLIPVFYHVEAAQARQVLSACYEGGVRVYEYTNRGPQALAIFTELQRFVEAEYPDLLLGAGTIFQAADAEKFIAAGADFIVSPVISAAVAAVCQRHNLAWLPGAFTVNEIFQAMEMGADIVKIFPASMITPAYIRTLRGPLPEVPLLVSGGVTPEPAALAEWFRAGASCVSIGSQLLPPVGAAGLAAHVAELLRGIKNATLV